MKYTKKTVDKAVKKLVDYFEAAGIVVDDTRLRDILSSLLLEDHTTKYCEACYERCGERFKLKDAPGSFKFCPNCGKNY